MSDMTSLSHEYEASADFARDVNDDALRLKKWRFAGAGIPMPSEEEIREARQRLVQVLQDLTVRLEAKGEPSRTFRSAIPGEVIDRLVAKHRNKMVYFIQDLRSATREIAGEGQIALPATATLDEICDAADASASASFRRLRRR
jgi:hypothetical protein